MAEVIDALPVETPPREPYSDAAQKAIPSECLPIEQRTDVTVDELERASLPCTAELYDGKIVFKEAKPVHGMIQGKLAAKLDLYLDQNPIGYALISPNFRLWPDRAKESRAPDVAFVKKERSPKDWVRFPEGAPNLAAEIISPDDKFEEMIDKVDEYLQQGAQMVWLIFTQRREVLVFTASSIYRVREVLTAPELLPGFELPLSTIFKSIPLPD
ncbi:Uma2 family endonuclease [candidate division KSB1 bacterium]|nr:Uma2 family endonuclease [candidate division KSB1 bacterium]